MPIRPENRDRYPPEWKAISERIRFDRAQNRCECDGRCGLHADRCTAVNYEPHPVTGSNVILTCAHLAHTPEHCDDENLMAMCQRCHLSYDMDRHVANRRRSRDARRGQLTMKIGDDG